MRKILIPVVVLLAVTGCSRFKNLVLIENNSNVVCTTISIAVCDSSWTLENLAPGEQHQFTVVYTSDDAFQVRVETADGGSLNGGFGYVTHGITGERIRISIENDHISFRQSGDGH